VLTYCNAGHNPPLLIRRSGAIERLGAMGTVLGIMPELGYEQQAVALEPGDLFAVYSDGITEAADPAGVEYGDERLARVLAADPSRSASQVVEAVMQDVDAWTAGAPPEDDVTLVVGRFTG
jgi:sigma-B regulation protein RsbU (phosphoserine phosphatase)